MASGVPRQYTRRHQQLQQQLQPRPHRRRMTRSNPDQDDYGGASSKQPFPSLSPDDLAATTAPQDDDLDYDHNYGHDDQTDPEDEEHDFQSQYSQESQSLSETSSDSDEQVPDDNMAIHHPFRQLTSSLHGPNAFAPPFYNRPPTPLPPSPSLTSLLRPPFSATTSRPTTPDGSDVETPDDTEAAVAKSARQATTVPRASPKVPTYEYYGFVLYLASSLAFCKFAMSQCFAERVRFTNIALI